MSRPDKSARKAKLKAWRESEHAAARARHPLDDATLAVFFAHVEDRRARHGCFHDLRHASAVIEQLGLSDTEADALLDWCNENGGYCDCEVAANAYGHWLETRVQGRLQP